MIEESLWPQVPADVIEEAKQTAQAEPTWIAMQGNGHVVVTVPPGRPDGATGDVIYIAEVTRRSRPLAEASRAQRHGDEGTSRSYDLQRGL